MASVKGIDVSSNNGRSINFTKVHDSGVKFVFVKVSEGTTYVNPYAARHVHDARAAGLIVGGYHFVHPASGVDPHTEADHFLANARKLGLLKAGSLRPAIDSETSVLKPGYASRRYHYGVIDRVISEANVHPFIYTGQWFWTGVLGARNSHKCPLWLAAYTSGWRKLIPYPWKGVSIHQYTDKGRVPGISTPCDLDLYLADEAHLHNNHVLKANH